jgi:mannose-6-phosphate isomerase-like protein (cupin superfamily)
MARKVSLYLWGGGYKSRMETRLRVSRKYIYLKGITIMKNLRSVVVRFEDLVPTYNTPHAKEKGYRRNLKTYVGGPEGFSNSNPEVAVVNDKIIVGVMNLPVGQRQYGVHKHSVAEIYIILKGKVASIHSLGNEEIAGPLDCLYMPAGAYHAVRNCGYEDVELLYICDDLEKKGTSKYLADESGLNGEKSDPVKIVRYKDLVPNWNSVNATIPGYLRWLVSYVVGPKGYFNNNPEMSIENTKINLGVMGLLPGNMQVSHKHPIAEVYFVYNGRFSTEINGENVELGPMDCVYFPAETYHSIRCLGPETGKIIYLHDRLAPKESTVWKK